MFLFQDSFCQRVFVVIIVNEYGPLHDDCPMIEFFIDEVNCASCNLYAVGKSLLLGF